MPEDIILLACAKSKTASSPIRFMNKLLSDLNQKNIHTIADAEKELQNVKVESYKQNTQNNTNFSQREYTKDQLNALFDSLDDIEV